MTSLSDAFDEVLAADAAKRAAAAPQTGPAAEAPADPAVARELRFRLVNDFPRETRPAFAEVRAALAPFGYTLSPLHPPADLRHAWMQTILGRATPGDAPHYFAPLIFELDPATARLRAYVRQFGGRPVPEFEEQSFDLLAPADLEAVTAVLRAYAVCMIRPLLTEG